MSHYTPNPVHQFVSDLWTGGNPGRDSWGGPTRAPLAADEIVRRLAELGAAGVCFHDGAA
jgi:xylose isomerase